MIWIGLVISFQKIYGLCGIKGHIVERRWDVTFIHGRTTECEDSARILKQNSPFENNIWLGGHKYMIKHRQSKLCETQKAIWWAWWVCVGDG